MKTLCLWVTATFLAVGSPLAVASTAAKFDGHWWASHRGRERLLLVGGEIDGSHTQCYRMVQNATYLISAAIKSGGKRQLKWLASLA